MLCAYGTRVDSWVLWGEDRRNANTPPWGPEFAGDMWQNTQQILYRQSMSLPPDPLHPSWDFSFHVCTVASLPWSTSVWPCPKVPGTPARCMEMDFPFSRKPHVPVAFHWHFKGFKNGHTHMHGDLVQMALAARAMRRGHRGRDLDSRGGSSMWLCSRGGNQLASQIWSKSSGVSQLSPCIQPRGKTRRGRFVL